MKKFSKILMLTAAFAAMPLYAQEEGATEEELPMVDVGFDIVSNYVWRGYDVHQSYFDQQSKSISGTNVAPAFQPSITVNTPLDGLSVGLWGSFAMVGRGDVDSDGRLQEGAGGSNILTDSGAITTASPYFDKATLESYLRTDALTDPYGTGAADGGLIALGMAANGVDYLGKAPGFYKEENGLKRVDEVDFTIDYSFDASIGSFSAGIVSYVLPNSVATGAATELYISYSPAAFDALALAAYYDIGSGAQYYNASLGHDFELSESVALSAGVGAGYGVFTGMQGVMDVTYSLGMSFGDFSVGLNLVNRPDLKMYDGDSTSKNVPAWIVGGSTNTDGLVADPSQNNGLVNEVVNGAIGNMINGVSPAAALYPDDLGYSYTPRQKLPSNLFYVSFGYSTSI